MTLELLVKVLPRPIEPIETVRPEGWPSIESTIGVALPQDYKDYIETYGSGQIGRFLWPANPFSQNKWLTLQNQIVVRLHSLKAIKEEWGEEECPYPLYPEVGGLLPWGYTSNGDTLFWLTRGAPQAWSVVINEARGSEFEQFSDSMTGFLTKLITGELHSSIIPYDALDRDALFVPGS
jgi:hypothetical protein